MGYSRECVISLRFFQLNDDDSSDPVVCARAGGGRRDWSSKKSSRMSVKNEKEDFSAAVNLFFSCVPARPRLGSERARKKRTFFSFPLCCLNWKHNKSGEGKKMNKKKHNSAETTTQQNIHSKFHSQLFSRASQARALCSPRPVDKFSSLAEEADQCRSSIVARASPDS